jgi:hypothetical protein
MFDPRVHMKLSKTDLYNLDELEKYEKIQWFVAAGKIITGSCFGHQALLHDVPRNATIRCLTQCYMVSITKKQFKAMLYKQEMK